MGTNEMEQQGLPRPDPALKRLEKRRYAGRPE